MNYLDIVKAHIIIDTANGKPEYADEETLRLAAVKIKLFVRKFENALIEANRQNLESCENIVFDD